MKNNTTDTKKPSRQEKVQALSEDLEKSIHEFMNGEKYMTFLSSMSKFHTYSLNNQLLIARQRPGATCCASYTTWNRLNRQVRKGESGIKIFCPAPYKSTVLRDAKDPATGKPCLLPDGSHKKEAVERIIPYFKVGYVFDISQTDGEALPEIANELTGDLDSSQKELKDALLKICPVPVTFRPIEGEAHGFYRRDTKEIVVDSTLSEKQSLKTLIHEMGHAMLHSTDIPDAPGDVSTREVQAESVAYVVCKYFGLDTSDYSFGYIAGWSSGRKTKELKASLETIREASNSMIDQASAVLEKARAAKQPLEQTAKAVQGRCM